MAPILYMTLLSPPSRAVLITAKAIGIDLELKNVDLMRGAHRSDEFMKINPLHAVPVLVDGSVTITDSHVINAYLVRKYGQNKDLYPEDLMQQIRIDQKLHFDTGIMFNLFRTTAAPIFYRKSKTVPDDQINRILEAYGYVETFLIGNVWIAGDKLTIADFSLFTTIVSLNVFVVVDKVQFPNVTNWLERLQQLNYVNEANRDGLEELQKAVEMCTK